MPAFNLGSFLSTKTIVPHPRSLNYDTITPSRFHLFMEDHVACAVLNHAGDLRLCGTHHAAAFFLPPGFGSSIFRGVGPIRGRARFGRPSCGGGYERRVQALGVWSPACGNGSQELQGSGACMYVRLIICLTVLEKYRLAPPQPPPPL